MTLVALVDIIYCPVVQLSVSAVLVRMPDHFFSTDTWITRPRNFERSRRLYRALAVHRWKKALPDAASLVGGTNKHAKPYSRTDVSRFIADTRRAETAHWLQFVLILPSWLWNPLWASILMTGYAIGANIPCIAAQRYNRLLVCARVLRCRHV